MLRIDEPEVPGVSPEVMWHSGPKGGVYNRMVSRDPETHGLSLTVQLPPPPASSPSTAEARIWGDSLWGGYLQVCTLSSVAEGNAPRPSTYHPGFQEILCSFYCYTSREELGCSGKDEVCVCLVAGTGRITKAPLLRHSPIFRVCG